MSHISSSAAAECHTFAFKRRRARAARQLQYENQLQQAIPSRKIRANPKPIMDTPTAAIPSYATPVRTTFRTLRDVVDRVRELLEASVEGLNELTLRTDLSEREKLTVGSLAALRQRAITALAEPSHDWTTKIHTTQYPVVFQTTLTLSSDLQQANTAADANEILNQVDQALVSALLAMKDGNPAISDFCESLADVVFQMERGGSIELNGEEDM